MNLSKKIEKALIKASTTYPSDRLDAFKRALSTEEDKNSIWALKLMIENAKLANKNKLALCDDTGIPHIFIEFGKDCKNVNISEFFNDINKGIANGFKKLPGRPMAVKGNEIERIEQSNGLYGDPSMMKAPSFLIDNHFKHNENDFQFNNDTNYLNVNHGDKTKIHLLLLGGGPEIRASTYRVFHKRSYKEILNIVISRLKKSLYLLGCTPTIPAIGIGRTHFEANSLMLKSMIYGNLNEQSSIEDYLTKELNKTNIGPMGFGGKTTAIGSFVNIGPQRASGVRIVAIRPCCFVEPRVATVEYSI